MIPSTYLVLEHNLKSNVRTILLIRRDLAFVLFDNRLCYGKSYAVTACKFSRSVSTVEAVKESVKFDFSNSGISIFNRQHNSSASVERYADLTALITILDGIVHQNADESVQ